MKYPRLMARSGLFVLLALVGGCGSTPPTDQHNLCSVFGQNPEWYDYARQSQKRWGTPPHIQMAFIRHESSYRSNAKPPYDWFLFIPLGRKSSAKGYAQIQDPVWKEYKRDRGSLLKSRGDMEDALDFVGWYNDKSHRQLGISKWDPYQLYLAYHEGHTGFRRGSYKKKPSVGKVARKVDRTAREYGAQLKECESKFRCDSWYQVWPFCS